MERRVTFHFEFGLSRRSLTGVLAVLFVFSTVGDLASESVTLTTYYPAPSGVYTQMITTGSTWLARDSTGSPSFVSVGTTNQPSSGFGMTVMRGSLAVGTVNQVNELDVAGSAAIGSYGGVDAAPGNGLIVPGNVGVGTPSPGTRLDVEGASGGTGDVAQFIDENGASGNAINIGTTQGTWGMLLGHNSPGTAVSAYHGPNWSYVINVQNAPLVLGANNGAVETITGSGYVGIGNTSPVAPLDVNGGVVSRQPGCWAVTFMDGQVVCNGSYATLISGFYANYVAMGTEASVTGTSEGGSNQGGNRATMTALCCPFPGGSAVF